MAYAFLDISQDVRKHVVQAEKGRMVYIMEDHSIVDPFLVRPTSYHASYDEALFIASNFVDGTQPMNRRVQEIKHILNKYGVFPGETALQEIDDFVEGEADKAYSEGFDDGCNEYEDSETD